MKSPRTFKIIVLEDSDFYNNLLTRQLQNYISEMAIDKGFDFDIQSYTNVNDCLRNLRPDTDIAIVDYYLNDSKNALDILKVIKEKCDDCKVLIISKSRNIKTSDETITEGASHFIYKDQYALAQSCVIVEEIINERLAQEA